MAAKRLDQAFLSKFFLVGAEGFGDAVGEEHESVAWGKLAFADLAIPLRESADDGGRRSQ